MGLAETANLAVKLSLTGNFVQKLTASQKALSKFDTRVSQSETRAYRAGEQIGNGIKNVGKLAVVGAGLLGGAVVLGLHSLVELEKQTAQTNAVIKSTKGVAGQTAGSIRALAEQYESLNATVGDEVIQQGENLLLTFTNIRKKAFEPALAAALDMNQALGKGPEGLSNTVRVLGKALNDPTKGLGALSRVGVTFSAEQTKRIKKLQQEGKLYEAQSIILGELNKRFGGSFLAGGNTTAGKVAKFTDAIEDLQRALATALLPAVGNIADALSDLLRDPEIQQGITDLGNDIGKLFSKDNIKNAAGILRDAFGAIRQALPGIRDIVSTIATVVGTAVDAFNKLPGPIKQLAIGGLVVNKLTGGLLTNVAGGVGGAILSKLRTARMDVQAAVVNLDGPVAGGGAGGAGAAGKSGASKLTKALSALSIIADIAGVIGTQQAVSSESTAQAQAIHETQKVYLAQSPTTDALQRSLAGVDQGIKDIQSNPLLTLVQGDALTTLQQMRGELVAQLTESRDKFGEVVTTTKSTAKDTGQKVSDGTAKTGAALNVVRDRVESSKIATVSAVTQAKIATDSVRDKVEAAKIAQVGAVNSAQSGIVGAIRANRPIITTNVNVSATSVTKQTTIVRRYGPEGGSKNTTAHKKP